LGFSCGIIGLPNSGKSTIFNALTALCVAAQPYPFCTIDPNVGVVPVPDARLAALARLVKPEKVTPTTIEFVDIAGLIKDAHKGEGLGNKFLGHIRAVDAIAHVVRCFQAENVPHIYADIDPGRDAEVVETEIIISDLELVEERLHKLERLAKVSKEKHEAEQQVLLNVRAALSRGEFVRNEDLSPDEVELVRSFSLITTKPLFYIANIDEKDLGKDEPAGLKELARNGRAVVSICGRLEEELASLPEEEMGSFMELYGMKERGIERVITAGYAILGLITFYTLVGKELRAWTIPKNTTVHAAAGKIHTDMQRGFIKAEVISCDDFVASGSEHAAREKGLISIEGKDYIVRDGDVLHIRFNV
jgi:GTP-binding protein YchF